MTKRIPLGWRIFGGVLFGLGVIGSLFFLGTRPSPPSPPIPGPTFTLVTPDTTTTSPAPNPTADCVPSSLAHCYTQDTMKAYLDVIIPIVENFYKTTWANMPMPTHIYFIALGQTMTEGCADSSGNPATGDENSYEYCPQDNNVYIGQAMIWLLYHSDGDIAPAVGLAHELGHDVQTQVSVPAPQTDQQTEIHENQADCVSGAFIGYEQGQGDLQPLDDIPSLARYISTISDATNDPYPTHGDTTVRTNAITYGWVHGIFSCNGYYSTPIIKS